MESPLCPANGIDRKGQTNKTVNKYEPTSAMDKMNSSMNSPLDDTTPSDSGVQTLDSESSEFMIESITSQTGFEFDEIKSNNVQERAASNEQVSVVAAPPPPVVERHFVSAAFEEIIAGIDNNSNVTTNSTTNDNSIENVPIEEAMTTSTCSTFDTTENIVYRRKVRKQPITPKAPKKRVSFHEDILKNTRTDNIHIEHGFITYKSGRKALQHVGVAGRYSWCSEGDGGAAGGTTTQTELCTHAQEDDTAHNGCEQRRRCIVYRNACSDVLDYGNSDVYDMEEQKALQYDNSGVFEYVPKNERGDGATDGGAAAAVGNGAEGQQALYRCSCSSSNSSLDSDENDKNSNRQQYGQAKSSSCDCIGMSNANNNIIGDNCYFSEPNIDNLNESNQKKSVWNKEKKPKSSCLKKPKRNTNVIYEQDLSTRVKKFNVHDMNQLIDNSSKIIIGSLKSIFTMPLPERGVPEGSEDLQSVVECIPELEQQTPEHKSKLVDGEQLIAPPSPPLKQKPFLSKSLDGSKKAQGKFVHNVDEQLRRKNEEDIYAPTRQSSAEKTATETPNRVLQRQEEIDGEQRDAFTQNQQSSVESDNAGNVKQQLQSTPAAQPQQFRNKFIVNCESTVFEHTGVSYCYETNELLDLDLETASNTPGSVASSLILENETPIAQPEPDQLRSAFSATPIAKTFSNFFRSFNKESTSTPNAKKQAVPNQTAKQNQQKLGADINFSPYVNKNSFSDGNDLKLPSKHPLPKTISSSTISELTNSSACSLPPATSKTASTSITVGSVGNSSNNSLAIGQDLRVNMEKQHRHLPSPLKKRASGSNLAAQPQRYGTSLGNTHSNTTICPPTDPSLLSPDIFNLSGGTTALTSSLIGGSSGTASGYVGVRGGCGRDSKSTILSEDFDDIITITTETDKNESDIVIVDYPSEMSERQAMNDYASLLKPPQPSNAKTSLINRFLRNVTQKKILESSIRKNNFFADKLRNEQRLLSGNLYVPGVKPKNHELIDDLNAEIAMEIEMSGANSPRRELLQIDDMQSDVVSRFELGIGEISIDVFNGNYLHILRDPAEQLMKVFKLYTGYSREGYMTPVLVFLTDRTLYVTDLVRSRLCSKFVLSYAELDVILLGPFGNTVLLSNSTRDMQQVLLAGGPYPADGLVANLEMCARRSGSSLPAVGQLSFSHLAPLQEFVRENSSVGATDTWLYYAVVNAPAGVLGSVQEPLGPHVKGFLMHRRIKEHQSAHSASKHMWNPGYFLLKAGVLYMFNDSTQKIPSSAMALAECQGARRAVKAGRPHCFEVILKGQLLQLAAPDEYVASEWLQALLQAASGLFEMQEKHKTLGCTLVVTQNHLITLREDFSAPLKQIKTEEENMPDTTGVGKYFNVSGNEEQTPGGETGSLLSSAMSTPTRLPQRSCSSMNSTPTKVSQISQSTATGGCNTTSSSTTNATTTNATSLATTTNITNYSRQIQLERGASVADARYSSMYSVYGKNSGIEILTCADIKEMTGIKIPSHNDTWWCVLEFSCQEVRESTDDLVIFFASSSEMQRFLRLLEQLWLAKNNDLFPITVLDEDDLIAEECTLLYMDINRAWEPLLTAALGYPL